MQMLSIPDTQEVEAGRLQVQSQPGKVNVANLKIKFKRLEIDSVAECLSSICEILGLYSYNNKENRDGFQGQSACLAFMGP